jgi:hypothetical protein
LPAATGAACGGRNALVKAIIHVVVARRMATTDEEAVDVFISSVFNTHSSKDLFIAVYQEVIGRPMRVLVVVRSRLAAAAI